MITNFEEITRELTEKEMKFIPYLVAGFKKHSKDDPIKAPVIVKKMNDYLDKKAIGLRLTQPRLRKCCNYIRTNGLIPLIATSKGYYVSNDKEEIKNQIQSLQERARSINDCARGLEKFLDQLPEEDEMEEIL